MIRTSALRRQVDLPSSITVTGNKSTIKDDGDTCAVCEEQYQLMSCESFPTSMDNNHRDGPNSLELHRQNFIGVRTSTIQSYEIDRVNKE